jgi:anti-sigma28 factor (negative regulator of flagellin synthesis)
MDQLPDVRADKVAALKSAINQKTYALSPRATADGILRHAAEATGTVQPRTTES